MSWKELVLMSLLLVGCMDSPNPTKEKKTAEELQEEQRRIEQQRLYDSLKLALEVEIELAPRYIYRFFSDSLYTTSAPLADGRILGKNTITMGTSHPLYNREDIPNPSYGFRTDTYKGVIEGVNRGNGTRHTISSSLQHLTH